MPLQAKQLIKATKLAVVINLASLLEYLSFMAKQKNINIFMNNFPKLFTFSLSAFQHENYENYENFRAEENPIKNPSFALKIQ